MALRPEDMPEVGSDKSIAPIALQISEKTDKKGLTWLVSELVPTPGYASSFYENFNGVEAFELLRGPAGMTEGQRDKFVELSKDFLLDALKNGIGLDVDDPASEASLVEVKRKGE